MVIVKNGTVDDCPAGTLLEYDAATEAWLVECGAAEYAAGAETEEPAPAADEGPKKAELEARCRELGLPVKGTKAQLARRIAEAEAAAGEDKPDGDGWDDEDAPELSAEVPR